MARKTQKGRRENNTGSIYKDGTGYRVQVQIGYDPATGKPLVRKVRAKTHEEAIQELKKLSHAEYAGKLAPAQDGNLETFLTNWLENTIKPNRAPKTHQQYAYVLNRHVIPTLGKKRIDQVKRADVQKLVSRLLTQRVQARSKDPKAPKPEGTLSRRTVAVTVAILHSAYEDAIRDGHAATNPASHIELPRVTKKPPQFLDQAQVLKLIEALDGTATRELILFMLATGTRLGEARGLRWQDLDLSNATVRIAGQLQRVEGVLTYIPKTKTNQDRAMALPKWIAEELQQVRSRQLVEGTRDPEGIVFLNAYGRRIDEKYVNVQLKEACSRAGIPLVSPHKLRHTAATLALSLTGDLHAVQKLLGHQQVSLTADLYGHATAERLRPIADGLGNLMKPV
ncbi:MAG TPA: tyrosine-type recombinase/integrase [Fimbriimonas sp.]|nr:tyrosine-type recombinase/integrase [Fimbriimonas sp.]